MAPRPSCPLAQGVLDSLMRLFDRHFSASLGLLIISSALPACSGAPTWDECRDADCYTQLAMQRWPTEPDAVAADIATLDVVAQEAVVLALVDAHPTTLETICQALSEGPAADRCNKLTERPHLLGGKANTALRQVGVPGLVDHTGIEALSSPWTDVPPRDVDCDMQVDACWSRAMVRAVQTGDPVEVAAICNSVPSDRFRRECFFRAAETLGVQDAKARVDRLPTAAALCLGAEDYNELCVRELGRAIARLAPPADQLDHESWEQAAAAVAALEAGLAETDAAVGQRVADRVWAAVVWGSYQRAQQLGGIPMLTLPPAAGPHIRATAAWFLLEREAQDHPERDLPAWIERATTILADTTPGPAPDDDQGVQPTRFVGNSTDPAVEPQPWVHYLGDNYRRVHDDPTQDLIACVLEAAARQGERSLLEPASVSSQSEPMQQHAASLLAAERKAPRSKGKRPPPPGTHKGPGKGSKAPPPKGSKAPPPKGSKAPPPD